MLMVDSRIMLVEQIRTDFLHNQFFLIAKVLQDYADALPCKTGSALYSQASSRLHAGIDIYITLPDLIILTFLRSKKIKYYNMTSTINGATKNILLKF